MQINEAERKICQNCPVRTPFMADPENLRRARELNFEPPLDENIRTIVETLIAHGVETFESCQGGAGHSFPEPTVRFEGEMSEGLRAVSVALAYGFRVSELRRTWRAQHGMLHGPWWEITFFSAVSA
jgi:hypothetical protein